jgi:tRNA G18 (ribose-2'-O)-methylase SpoU
VKTAVFHVRFQQVESLDALIKKASSAGMNIYLTSALYPGETVRPGNLRSPCLILFGNEGQGLPPELFLSYPSIKIEQTKKVESLNVGVSACIIMHELKK